MFKKFTASLMIAAVTIGWFLPFSAQAAMSRTDYVNSKIYNLIISNSDFLDVNSMSASDIQAFLDSNNSWLKSFSENGRSAAQIIYDAAHGGGNATGTKNGIVVDSSTGTVSPKVLLVTLQKEQSLITRTSVTDRAVYAAMGYQCYSTVPGDYNGNLCKDSTEGFTKQVEYGAWQFRYNHERSQGKGLDYQVGQTFTASDGYSVTMMNAATASLYRYTPYVFNGNFNFYNYYNAWFTAHSDVQINDTANFTIKTYGTSQTISGVKSSETIAYLGDTQIAGLGTRDWTVNLNGISTGTNEYTIQYKNSGGTLVATKSVRITVQKAADINGDNGVNVQDLSIFANYWSDVNPEEPLSDLNGDHEVNIMDLSILAANWGK